MLRLIFHLNPFPKNRIEFDHRSERANALCRTRTYDPLIKSQLLCQLS